ncbi:MAG TPA: hypothetical protein VIY08_14345 [Candidatus Nitrosocosmicus sp.]
MIDNISKQVDLVLQYSISPITINSGDAVGRYTGIKASLFSSKYFSTFFDYNEEMLYP